MVSVVSNTLFNKNASQVEASDLRPRYYAEAVDSGGATTRSLTWANTASGWPAALLNETVQVAEDGTIGGISVKANEVYVANKETAGGIDADWTKFVASSSGKPPRLSAIYAHQGASSATIADSETEFSKPYLRATQATATAGQATIYKLADSGALTGEIEIVFDKTGTTTGFVTFGILAGVGNLYYYDLNITTGAFTANTGATPVNCEVVPLTKDPASADDLGSAWYIRFRYELASTVTDAPELRIFPGRIITAPESGVMQFAFTHEKYAEKVATGTHNGPQIIAEITPVSTELPGGGVDFDFGVDISKADYIEVEAGDDSGLHRQVMQLGINAEGVASGGLGIWYGTAYFRMALTSAAAGTFNLRPVNWATAPHVYKIRAVAYAENGFVVPTGTVLAPARAITPSGGTNTIDGNATAVAYEAKGLEFVLGMASGQQLSTVGITSGTIDIVNGIEGRVRIVGGTADATVTYTTEAVNSESFGRFFVRASANNSAIQPSGNGIFRIENAIVDKDVGGLASYDSATGRLTVTTGARWATVEANFITRGTSTGAYGYFFTDVATSNTGSSFGVNASDAVQDAVSKKGIFGATGFEDSAVARIPPSTTVTLEVRSESSANNQRLQRGSYIAVYEDADSLIIPQGYTLPAIRTITPSGGTGLIDGLASASLAEGVDGEFILGLAAGDYLASVSIDSGFVSIVNGREGRVRVVGGAADATLTYTTGSSVVGGWTVRTSNAFVVQGGGAFAMPTGGTIACRYKIQDGFLHLFGSINWNGSTGGNNGSGQYSIDISQFGGATLLTDAYDPIVESAGNGHPAYQSTFPSQMIYHDFGVGNGRGGVVRADADNSISFGFSTGTGAQQGDWGSDFGNVGARAHYHFSCILPLA